MLIYKEHVQIEISVSIRQIMQLKYRDEKEKKFV